jgi:hypothetical protein
VSGDDSIQQGKEDAVGAGARCVAVESPVKGREGPPLGLPRGHDGLNGDPTWLLPLVPLMRGQDNAYFSKKHILALSADSAPIVVKHRAGDSQGLVYAMLVAPNNVSVKAALLIKALLRDQDKCLIVHYVQHKSQVDTALNGFMKQYQVLLVFLCKDALTFHLFFYSAAVLITSRAVPSLHDPAAWSTLLFVVQTQAKNSSQLEVACVARGETPVVDMIQEMVADRALDVLVVPTDTLGQQDKEAVGSLSLMLLRNIRDVSFLIVKANSVGNAHKSDILAGAPVQ